MVGDRNFVRLAIGTKKFFGPGRFLGQKSVLSQLEC